MLDNRKVIIDDKLLIANTGSAVQAAAGAATVDGVAKVIDTGGGYTDGRLVIDIATITMGGITASCAVITLALEGSTTSTFTTFVRLAGLRISGVKSATDARISGDFCNYATPSIGRYIIPFHNDFHGTIFRWLRIYSIYDGSCGHNDGLKFKAWLTKK
jgi:hypothetical protein